jgi:hypothetical protein
MMNSDELVRAQRRAIARQSQRNGTGTTPSSPAGAFVPGTGLRRVSRNFFPPAASHRPMVYEPLNQ